MPEYLPAPVGGWNPDVVPWEIPVSEAPQLDNFLFQPGKLVMRGPLVVTADLSTWYPLNLAGSAMTNTGAMLSRKSTTGGQVDPWNAPLLMPASADLASGLTTGLWVVGGSVSTYNFASADAIPGPRWINFDGLLYGISYDSAGAAVTDANSNYYMKPCSLCTLAKSAPGGQPSAAASSYSSDNASGSTAWTIGSEATAAAPVQSQTLSAGSYVAASTNYGWFAGSAYGDPDYYYDLEYNNGADQYTPWLYMTDFGFSIPANAEIVGISIGMEASIVAGGGNSFISGVQLVDNSQLVGVVKSSGAGPITSGSWMLISDGGSNDLWGASWTPADINSSSFGVAFQGGGHSDSTLHPEAMAIRAATDISVYYRVPTETQYLEATGFGFNIPSTAVIQGIAVTVTRNANNAASDAAIQLVKGGTVQAANRSAGAGIPSTWNAATFGGSTDLWGTAWAYTDINAANFGAVYQASAYDTVNVQSIIIQVWWTSGASETITVLSNAPHGAFDLIGYQSRIWLLGGIDTPGNGTTHNPIALFFTNPIASGGGTASSDWKDPVSGLTNVIVMDGDSSDYGVGLATVRNGIVIFRRASIYLLKGSTTANYTLVPVSRDMGCLDARSIIEADEGVYFVSTEGLMLTNGTKVVNISGSITHTLRTAIAAEQKAVIAGSGGYITCGRTTHGQIVVSIGIGSTQTAGSYAPIFTAMYDPEASKAGSWVRLTSQLWENDGSQSSGNNYCGPIFDYKAPKRLLAFGDRYVTAIEDQAVGLSMLNYNAGLYDQLPSGANPYVAIPAVWKSVVPAITTAAKRTFGQAKRYYIDYNFAAQNLTPLTGWSINPVDASGAAMDTTQNVPVAATPTMTGPVSGITPVPGEFIMRLNRDWWHEVGDFCLVVTWSDIARAQQAGSSVAEIYGAGVEFQHTSDRR